MNLCTPGLMHDELDYRTIVPFILVCSACLGRLVFCSCISHKFVCLSTNMCVCLSAYMCLCLLCLYVCLSLCLYVCLSMCLYLNVYSLSTVVNGTKREDGRMWLTERYNPSLFISLSLSLYHCVCILVGEFLFLIIYCTAKLLIGFNWTNLARISEFTLFYLFTNIIL